MSFYKTQIEAINLKMYSNDYLTQRVKDAKHYIDMNYAGKLTLQDICNSSCISKFYMIRAFKYYYGITPNRYLSSVRIKNAKKLLSSGNSVLETCYSVGFESPTTFAGLFKKYVGTSPSKFKIKKGNFEEAEGFLDFYFCILNHFQGNHDENQIIELNG